MLDNNQVSVVDSAAIAAIPNGVFGYAAQRFGPVGDLTGGDIILEDAYQAIDHDEFAYLVYLGDVLEHELAHVELGLYGEDTDIVNGESVGDQIGDFEAVCGQPTERMISHPGAVSVKRSIQRGGGK